MNINYQSNINPASEPSLLTELLQRCLSERNKDPLIDHREAKRLFNGFYEGLPGLVVDLYKDLIVISNHERSPLLLDKASQFVASFYRENLPGLKSVLIKQRHAKNEDLRLGYFFFGKTSQTQLSEDQVEYAIDLRFNQDESFYLDTRNLRAWVKLNLHDKSLLNCFAYTGSLGVSALVGGAKRVVQTDHSLRALNWSKKSAKLNGVEHKMELLAMDFFKAIGRLKREQELFDCVIVDPPLYSNSEQGKVDLLNNWIQLINKARPLVAHEGWLVSVNNALYLEGQTVMEQLNELTNSGYLKIEQLIKIPSDITGYPDTIVSTPPVDPSPFNHPTKIAIMRVSRKDGRRAS